MLIVIHGGSLLYTEERTTGFICVIGNVWGHCFSLTVRTSLRENYNYTNENMSSSPSDNMFVQLHYIFQTEKFHYILNETFTLNATMDNFSFHQLPLVSQRQERYKTQQ